MIYASSISEYITAEKIFQIRNLLSLLAKSKRSQLVNEGPICGELVQQQATVSLILCISNIIFPLAKILGQSTNNFPAQL
jgi:hypothetical protein